MNRFRKGKFLVYWMAGEHNLVEYFTKHQPTSHHWSQRSTYIVPAADSSKYSCYMSHNYLQGCVVSLPARGNGQHKYKASLLHGKEMDDGQTDTNRPKRQTQHWRG